MTEYASNYPDGPGCEGCKFLLREEQGYGPYTITGESVECLKGVNPGMPLCDEDVESAVFNAALAFGETCPERVAGQGPWYDIEAERKAEDYKGDPDVYALLVAREAPP